MVVGLLGNESSDSNRFTLVTPKSENDVRLQATLGSQNPTGLPVGVVRNQIDGHILLSSNKETIRLFFVYNELEVVIHAENNDCRRR